MACIHPISTAGPKGPILVACKQCLPCRIQKQRQLTLRCLLENQSGLSAQFLTLTFSDDPGIGSYKPFQMFMNRLRTWNTRQSNALPIRYLGCGEYGKRTGRFHYHALVWNSLEATSRTWQEQLWPLGFAHIGTVTPSSISYTVRYTLKFQEPGREPVQGWSKSPPLGGVTMRALGEKYRSQGHVLQGPPSVLRMDGSTYPVDTAMQIEFAEGYNPAWITRSALGTRRLESCDAIRATLEYRSVMQHGDPIADYRAARESKAVWYQNQRKLDGKL